MGRLDVARGAGGVGTGQLGMADRESDLSLKPKAMTTSTDQDQLKLLTVFHYVLAGITAFFACIPLIHLTVGLVMLSSPQAFGNAKEAPPAFVGWLFAGLGAFFFVCGQTVAVCLFLSARKLQRRTGYWFVFTTACVSCLFMPFGTVLGVFTIIVLSRESVKGLFAGNASLPPAG